MLKQGVSDNLAGFQERCILANRHISALSGISQLAGDAQDTGTGACLMLIVSMPLSRQRTAKLCPYSATIANPNAANPEEARAYAS